jgi:hyaluronoglucosaminidase
MGLFTFAGVLEGFYGRPWTWEQRRAVMERCIPAGMPWYCWAPKSDPLHRKAWREPFSDEHLAGFADLLSIEGLKLCVGIAPGMEPGTDLEADVAALIDKLDPVLQLVESVGSHVPMVMVAFDDLGPELTDPERHAAVVRELNNNWGDRALLAAIPVHYASIRSTAYLQKLSEGLPPDVLIGWTGPTVVNDQISATDAESFADAVDGRPLLLWDNYPVNDVFMSDRLFLHPLRGRDELLPEFCAGYFANAAVQPMLSLPPLLSAAAWCETGTVAEVWDEFDEPVQLALLAEACEGKELYRLAVASVDDLESNDFDDLWWWLERLEVLELTGEIGDQAKPWIDQTVAEAKLCLVAVELLERELDDEDVPAMVLDVLLRWPAVRRAAVTVFGSRFAVTPTLGIGPTGEWSINTPPVTEDRNATDVLCRAAIARHSPPAA